MAFDAIDLSKVKDVESPETAQVEAPEVERPEVETHEVDESAPIAQDSALEEVVAEESALDLYLASSNLLHDAAEPVVPVEPVAKTAAETPATSTTYDLLDPRSPAPEATGDEDETPIFRALRSNWLTSGADEDTWTTSEIEAGWEAAEQVAEAPALQLSESGLPMRRPGKRLVPGGVTPAPTIVDRDPEAIRARLAAHAAGVSRGRTAAVDESVPAASTEEGPA